MTILTLLTWLLSLSALLASIVACFVAFRTSGRTLSRQLREHSDRFSEIETQLEAMSSRIKSIRAQVNAVNLSRSRNSEVPEVTSETIEEAKDRCTRETNQAIALGKFRRQ